MRDNKKYDEAIVFLTKSAELLPRFLPFLNLAGIYRVVNDPVNFERAIREAKKFLDSESWYHQACFYSIAGNSPAAFECLEKAAQDIHFDAQAAWQDPDLEWIREDPRFTEIVGPKPSGEVK